MHRNLTLLLLTHLLVLSSLQLIHAKAKRLDMISFVEKLYQRSACSKKELYDKLWYFYQKPLDLNQATQQDMEQLSILSEKQLAEFLKYMSKNAPLLSIYELQAIPFWDLVTIRLIEPFIKVDKTNIPREYLHNFLLSKEKLQISFERDFFTESKKSKQLLGDASKLYMSYTQRLAGHYSIGVLAKKDAGELMINPDYYYLPYCAGHAMIENYRFIKKAIIGHYQIGFGQGLVMYSGFNIDKNAEAIYILRANQQGIKPTTSYSRKNGFQGFATALTKSDFITTLYGSKRSLDAKLYNTNGENHVRSIQNRGFVYTNKNALDKKDSLQEQVLGATLVYCPKETFELGIQAIDYQYTQPIRPRKNYYNADHFSGKQGANVGAFGRILWQNMHFFGEAAISKNKGEAALAGMMISLGKRLDTALLWRYYSSKYHAMYGKAFGRNEHNRNEHGIYLGLKLYPNEQISVGGYIDFFKHPKAQYRAHTAKKGRHWLINFSYRPTRNTSYQLKLKNSTEPYDRSKVSTLDNPILDLYQKSTLSLKLDYLLNFRLRARTQAQLCRHLVGNKNPNYGYGLMQSFFYKKNQITFKTYLALFYAKEYSARLCFYIPDIMPNLKYPQLYGKGMRAGFSINYPLKKKMYMKAQFSLVFCWKKGSIMYKPIFSCTLIYK